MHNDQDWPSTETPQTFRPPKGEDVKRLVTPGDDAAEEADAENTAPPPGAGKSGANTPEPGAAAAEPTPGEAPEEEQSPT
jgi:hypothetical protein